MAEQILAEGRADIIGMTRALIADPYWPEKQDLDRAQISTLSEMSRLSDWHAYRTAFPVRRQSMDRT